MGDEIIQRTNGGLRAVGASGKTYAKSTLVWLGDDGNMYREISGAMFPVIDARPTNPTTPGQSIPRSFNLQNVGGFLLAVAVMSGVTLALPKKYGSYVPYLIFASYAAYKSGVVNRALTSIGVNQK